MGVSAFRTTKSNSCERDRVRSSSYPCGPVNTVEAVATILIALPALLYAGACLAGTEDMVAMMPKPIPGIRMLVRVLGVVFLASAILINVERFAPAAGWATSAQWLSKLR